MLLSVSSIQFADGFAATGDKLHYNVQVGETQMLNWTILNFGDDTIRVEIYAEGEGSELLVFEEIQEVSPKGRTTIDVFVVIPDDHSDNIEYHPKLFALLKGSIEEGVSGVIVNQQMKNNVIIKIGDNPIYTTSLVEKANVPKVEEKIVEEPKEETMEEKLARIRAANAENTEEKTPSQTTRTENTNQDTQVNTASTPEPKCGSGTTAVNGICVLNKSDPEPQGGGCLIATATFGSEMAPQVQLLREIRDNQLMNTASGVSFMTGFNQLYYSFSPIIADMERENPGFKELVKIGITPLLSSLSIMEYAESDSEVLGYGIGVILLNLGMYAGIPAFGILKFYQFRRN